MNKSLLPAFIFYFVSTCALAQPVPYSDLVGVWASSQDVVNHNLSDEQVAELCGQAFAIFHQNGCRHQHQAGVVAALKKEI